MPAFRKRPVEIQANEWFRNGDHPDNNVGETLHDPLSDSDYKRCEGAIVRFFRRPDVPGISECRVDNCGRAMHDHGWIDTLEGGHRVCPGDWIITSVQGEHHPIKASIFAATYEPVDGNG